MTGGYQVVSAEEEEGVELHERAREDVAEEDSRRGGGEEGDVGPPPGGNGGEEEEQQGEEGGVDDVEAGEGGVEVRVLDVKNRGETRSVWVRGTRVGELMEAIERALDAPVARQRLICAGRQMGSDDLLETFKIEENEPTVTVHLMRRSADPEPPTATPVEATTANPLRSDALTMAFQDPEGDDIVRRLALETGRTESTIRTASRVRLLSSLLALYCALNALTCLTQETTQLQSRDERTRQSFDLGLNLGGLYVSYQGLAASKRLDVPTAERYDRSLRLLSLGMLTYEAYYHVILPSGDSDDDGQSAYVDDGDDDGDESSEFTPPTNGTSPEPDSSSHHHKHHHDDDRGSAFAGDDAAAANAAAEDDQDNVSRDSQILSGFIVLTFWSGIWLVCVNNSARLRLDLREQDFAHTLPTIVID